jgi:hypothetical protein
VLSFGYFSLHKQRKVTRRKAKALALPLPLPCLCLAFGFGFALATATATATEESLQERLKPRPTLPGRRRG